MKELFRSTDPTQITFAQALLQAEDITPFVLDVHMSVLEGSIGIFPRRMMVIDDEYDEAVEILKANEVDAFK